MARIHIKEFESSYYPPRARWYSKLLNTWFALQHRWRLPEVHLPTGIAPKQAFFALFLPGYPFLLRRKRALGLAVFATYIVSLAVFIAFIGYAAASIAYGLIISSHATSIFFFELHWLRPARFRIRFSAAALTLFAAWGLVYSPIVRYANSNWFLPVRIGDRVLVVSRNVSPVSLRSGDVVAYYIRARSGDGIVIRDGLCMAPVLAVGGDHVEFGTGVFKVNSETRPTLPLMPTSGEFVVHENQWFIWPNLDIRGAAGSATPALMEISLVSEDQLVGKAFKKWFWRRQDVE